MAWRLLLSLLSLAALPAPGLAQAARTIKSQADFIAVLKNDSVSIAQLGGNLRLAEGAEWGNATLVRSSDLTIDGGAQLLLLDFNLVAGKLMLLPGVTLEFRSMELRNVTALDALEVPFLTASPGAILLYHGSVSFRLVCPPAELFVATLRAYPRPGPDQVAQQVQIGGPWCRSQKPIAACYSHSINARNISALLPRSTNSGGGYVAALLDTILVCKTQVPTACIQQIGIDRCGQEALQRQMPLDDAWRLLAQAQAEAEQAGGGRGGGGSGVSAGTIAGAVVGGVAGAALLAAALLLILHRHRRGGAAFPPASASAVALSLTDPSSYHGHDGCGTPAPHKQVAEPEAEGCSNSDASLATGRCLPASRERLPASASVPAADGGGAGQLGSSGSLSRGVRKGSAGVGGGSGTGIVTGVGSGAGTSTSAGTGTWALEPGSQGRSPSAVERWGVGAQATHGDGVTLHIGDLTVVTGVCLGQGSFGRVFKGSWHGQAVAVKVLQYSAARRATVLNEVQLSQSLRHPNIVRTLEFIGLGFEGGQLVEPPSTPGAPPLLLPHLQPSPELGPCTSEAGPADLRDQEAGMAAKRASVLMQQPRSAGSTSVPALPEMPARSDLRGSAAAGCPTEGCEVPGSGNLAGTDISSSAAAADAAPALHVSVASAASAFASALGRPVLPLPVPSAPPLELRCSDGGRGGEQVATAADMARLDALLLLARTPAPTPAVAAVEVGPGTAAVPGMPSSAPGSKGFLVMELCEGGSLHAWRRGQWTASGERPDVAVLLRLAHQIACGMAYLHSQGVCHGDVKLRNVLLGMGSVARAPDAAVQPLAAEAEGAASGCLGGSPGLGMVAKVCDFGLARVLAADATHVSTRVHGTATHLAPEMWAEGHVSQHSDVYSFGVTLWELATGDSPWRGLAPGAILHSVLLSAERPPLPAWLPPAYARLVQDCWAQVHLERPSFARIVERIETMKS